MCDARVTVARGWGNSEWVRTAWIAVNTLMSGVTARRTVTSNKYSQLVPQFPSNIQHRDQAQQSQGGRVVSTNPAIPVRWGVQAQQWSCGRACREESLTPTFRSADVQWITFTVTSVWSEILSGWFTRCSCCFYVRRFTSRHSVTYVGRKRSQVNQLVLN